MSLSRCFTLLGDSNIRRNVNSVNCRDRPLMKAAQVVVCKKISLLGEALKEVREASNVCVISCLSNFISDAPDEDEGSSSTARTRAEPVLLEFRTQSGPFGYAHGYEVSPFTCRLPLSVFCNTRVSQSYG